MKTISTAQAKMVLKPSLRKLRGAFNGHGDIDHAIADYQLAIDSLPAQYGGALELFIRETAGLTMKWKTGYSRESEPVIWETVSLKMNRKTRRWRKRIVSFFRPTKNTSDCDTSLRQYSRLSVLHPPSHPDERVQEAALRRLDQYPRLAVLYLSHPDERIQEAALRHLDTTHLSPFLLSILGVYLEGYEPYLGRDARGILKRQTLEFLSGALLACDESSLLRLVFYFLLPRTPWKLSTEQKRRLIQALAKGPVKSRLAKVLTGATHGPTTQALLVLLEFDDFDRYLPQLARHAAQPTLRSFVARTLQNGYAQVYLGEYRRRPLLQLSDISAHFKTVHPIKLRGDVKAEWAKVVIQRPLTCPVKS